MPTLHYASQMPLGHKETMAQLQQAISLADRSAQELRCAPCSFASSSSSPPVQDLDVGINVAAPLSRAQSTLQQKQKFVELIMCDFTPRHPKDLPTSQWVSYDRLFQLFQPLSPLPISKRGPSNFKQRIVEWYEDDPTFIGLASSSWCKRVTSAEPQNGSGKKYVFKFSFEYTAKSKAVRWPLKSAWS